MVSREQMEAFAEHAKQHKTTIADVIYLCLEKIEWLEQFGLKTDDDPEWRK